MSETRDETWELVGPSKSVFEKGGSLAVCIPGPIVQYLGLHTRDQLVFVLDKENRCFIAAKKDNMSIRLGERKVAFHVPISIEKLAQITRVKHKRH